VRQREVRVVGRDRSRPRRPSVGGGSGCRGRNARRPHPRAAGRHREWRGGSVRRAGVHAVRQPASLRRRQRSTSPKTPVKCSSENPPTSSKASRLTARQAQLTADGHRAKRRQPRVPMTQAVIAQAVRMADSASEADGKSRMMDPRGPGRSSLAPTQPMPGVPEDADDLVQPRIAEDFDVVGHEAQHIPGRCLGGNVPLGRITEILGVLNDGQPPSALEEHLSHGRSESTVVDHNDLDLGVRGQNTDALDAATKPFPGTGKDNHADLGWDVW
jgi:hypothetical protein